MDIHGIIDYENYNNIGNGKYRTDRIEQQHVQFDSFPIWSKNKIVASRDVFDDYEFNEDFIWNFIMYHNRWSELAEDDFNYTLSTEKGGYFLTGLGTGVYTPIPDDQKMELTSVCYPYFIDIIEYCQQKDIQVLCTRTPYTADATAQQVANTIGDIVEQYPNCNYVNMLKYDILDYDTDLSPDGSHLNYSGALKVTTWLGQYLTENYEFDDYSTNSFWVEDYGAYYDYKEKALNNQTLLVSYLVQLKDDDFSAEIEIYDQSLMESERLMKLLNNANIIPVYVEPENANDNVCVRLKISSQISGELIDDVKFAYTLRRPDLLTIYKITE